MAANDATLPGALLRAAGLKNLVTGPKPAYPLLTPEDMGRLRPEVVCLPSDPYEFGPAEVEELARLTGACRLALIPGPWLTWYGVRTAKRCRYLRQFLAVTT